MYIMLMKYFVLCFSPESENDTECSQCALNHYKYDGGCDVCSDNCNRSSSSNVTVCNHDNGSCLGGCINGRYHGDKCDEKCPHLCVNSLCHRDGSCRDCRFNFQGPR